VSLFEPQGGPSAGGTHLLVHGSGFRSSEHLKCSWDNNTDPALKVDATYINYHTFKCISPPISTAGPRSLEVALDDFHFTTIGRSWTYYDPAGLIVSAVDPVGGPVRGGTLIEILGEGFAKLGGMVQHAGPAFPADHPEAHRRVDAGTFCKFQLRRCACTAWPRSVVCDECCTSLRWSPRHISLPSRGGHGACPRGEQPPSA